MVSNLQEDTQEEMSYIKTHLTKMFTRERLIFDACQQVEEGADRAMRLMILG